MAYNRRCPLWVISGHFAMRERCLLYPNSGFIAPPCDRTDI